MGLKTYQEKMIQQMITQEEMLSKLYGYFSIQFPEYNKFWEHLAKEEQRHARLIQKLFDAAKRGKIFFDEGKIKTYTLSAFVSRL
ncbi:MAG: rubrerythrin family protein, partial [Candidatus Marinimicrobia bacterium]|nr:rubrerythrin family protein [Candidatus Neomarinimicrobiota bacterium]